MRKFVIRHNTPGRPAHSAESSRPQGSSARLGLYERMGVPTVINADGNMTTLGGSLMPPVALEAMAEASRSFVDLRELRARVCERIAELTQNEAAFVSTGAAACMMLATAACVTGEDQAKAERLPRLEGFEKGEVAIFKSQRNGFDHAIRAVGVDLVEVGTEAGATVHDLERAIGERTAAVFYFAGSVWQKGAPPLDRVIEIAHASGAPVIVDAAAQLPPVENLWRFTQMGADLVIFSGGKGICGPQPTGLILGRADLMRSVALNSSPLYAIGRPLKVGKEELAGLLASLEWYLGIDQKDLAERRERQVQYMIEGLSGVRGVTAVREFPGEVGVPIPRALITLDPDVLGLTKADVVGHLWAGDPRIALGGTGEDEVSPNTFYVNPQTLEEGEERLVLARLLDVLGA